MKNAKASTRAWSRMKNPTHLSKANVPLETTGYLHCFSDKQVIPSVVSFNRG